jgi:SAM-dependent methyltransferase
VPSIDENKFEWDGNYNWMAAQGDEWSASWGGPFMQWYGTILPRIHRYIPTECILEIACGYGRWTQYLKDLCKNIIVVDLSEECINACKRRFANCSHIEYYINDGKSLSMIRESCIDFVFSFDALVHADDSVMRAYIFQLRRILKERGVAFIHHSNLGQYYATYSAIRKIPKLEGLLKRLSLLPKDLGWRDFSVDAKKVESLALENGLKCVSQEIIPWIDTRQIYADCISTITKDDTLGDRKNHIVRNSKFMEEAQHLLRISQIYNP